ncbi:MAG: threonylcarbamoyl-AMP synthase [Nitrospinae bacterium]|nr:threonylcarbamoyl-AMP synthase [Nitrospinota bacterium]
MKTLYLRGDAPEYRTLKEAAQIVLAGGVMVYPTDTIYGLGCGIFSKSAIERIAKAKLREGNKPFSFVCRDVAQISEFAFVSNWAYRLVNRLLPGPYTFILEARKTAIPKKMIGKRNTVGIRIPDSPVCNMLVEIIGHPIVSTSVNLAGGEPLNDPADLPAEISRFVDVVVSAGPLISEPSTVVDLTGSAPVTLRQGKGEIIW